MKSKRGFSGADAAAATVVLLVSIAIVQSSICSRAFAAERPWQTRPNSLVCPSYFSMTDGEAAVARRDESWLKETQCVIVPSSMELTILQEPPLTSTSIWRIRLHINDGKGATVYIRPYNVLGWAADGVGPLAYNEVFHRNAEIRRGSEPEPRRADPAAFDKLMKALKEKPADKQREPVAYDLLLKKLTQEQTPQNDEPPRRTATESGAFINLIKQQLVPCWNVPAGARDAKELNVQIRASVNPDGTVRTASIIDQGRMSDPLIRAAAESARRTFFNPQCTPLKLPSDKYEVWKDLVVNFDPRDLL